MENTTNFMNSVRTIARKSQFQYMVLENYAIPAVRFTPSDYWEKMEIVKKLAKTGKMRRRLPPLRQVSYLYPLDGTRRIYGSWLRFAPD